MRTTMLLTLLAMSLAPSHLWGAPNLPVLTGFVGSGSGTSQQAVAGAEVTVYLIEEGRERVLAKAVADAGGKFRTPLRAARRDGIVYAVARKGSTVELMSLIGSDVPTSITINEMTTVSSAYAMARLFQDGRIPNRPLLPAQVAVGMAHNLVSVVDGTPTSLIMTSPNADETNAWRLLGTLSNILVPCVRATGSACSQLFALTTAKGEAVPTSTLQAMVSVARHPAANVGPLFQLGSTTIGFTPSLGADMGPEATKKQMQLDAFTLAIKVNATGTVDRKTGQELCPFGGVANVAFGTDGYAWITNNVVQGTPNATNCIVVLKPDGSPADGVGPTPRSPVFGGGVVGQAFGVGFDPSGTVWSGNFGWGTINPTNRAGAPAGSVSRFTRRGAALSPPFGYAGKVYRVQGVVSDRRGNIWIASFGNNLVQVFPGGDLGPSSPVYQDANTLPFDVRLDNDDSAWVTYNGTQAVSKFKLVGGSLKRLFSVTLGTPSAELPSHITGGPKGVALDTFGNAWIGYGDSNAIFEIGTAGNILGKFTGGGINGPWGVSLASDQTIWVANFGPFSPSPLIKFRISQLCGADASQCPSGLKTGDPISPETGYTLPSAGTPVHLHNGQLLYSSSLDPSYDPLMRLTSVNVDMTGNVWCTNNWKPSFLNDVTVNPGGDGVVIFIGLAAPVKPLLYSAPPISPFAGNRQTLE